MQICSYRFFAMIDGHREAASSMERSYLDEDSFEGAISRKPFFLIFSYRLIIHGCQIIVVIREGYDRIVWPFTLAGS